jgi:hypothetical protein
MTCFVGLDVSMTETAYCIRNAEGCILGQGGTATGPDASALLAAAPGASASQCPKVAKQIETPHLPAPAMRQLKREASNPGNEITFHEPLDTSNPNQRRGRRLLIGGFGRLRRIRSAEPIGLSKLS